MWTKIHLTDSDIVKFEGNYWYFILDGKQYKLNELSYPNIKNVIDKLEAYLKRNGAWPCNTVSYDELKNILTDHLESCYHFELSKILIRINKYDFRYRRDDKFWAYYKVLGGNYPKKIDSLSIEELASIKNCFDKDDVTITYSTTVITTSNSTTVITTSSSFESITKLATDNLMKVIDALLYNKMKEQMQSVVSTAVDSNHNHSDIISNDSAVNNIPNESFYIHGVDYCYNVDSELWVWSMFEGPISGPKPLKDLHEITLTQARKYLLDHTDLKICSENFAFSVKHLLSNIEEALKVKYSQPVNVANETHDVYTVNLSNSVLFLARNKQSHLVPFIEKWAYYERVQYHERAQTDETALWKTISSASKKDLRRLSDTVLQEELIHLETNNIIDKNFLIDLLKHVAKVISEKKLAKKLG